jgi:uncharacterized membrane protein YdbT with pleckstrin-like domain
MVFNFMNLNSNETIWRRQRLHKGIFCIPALIFALPLIPLAVAIFTISMVSHQMNQILPVQQPQPSLAAMFYLPLIVLGGGWLIINLVVFLSTLLAYLKSEITLTNQRLLFKTGFIMRVSGELPLANIETIFLVEPLLGRLVGYGTILVTTVGGARFPLRYIGTPKIFHIDLQSAVAVAKNPPARAKPPAPPADDASRFMPKG